MPCGTAVRYHGNDKRPMRAAGGRKENDVTRNADQPDIGESNTLNSDADKTGADTSAALFRDAPTAASDPQASHSARSSRMAAFIAVVAVCVILDRVSKLAALRYLADGRRISVLGNVLGLKLLFNPGASLGMGSGATPVIAVLACAACVLLCVAAWRTESTAWTVALALCCAGALGNLIDRVYYATGVLNGKVVDFIDYGWSIGNVADVELFVAAVVVVVLVLADVPYATRHKESASDADGGGDGTPDGSLADSSQREGGAA